jgi:hypothetical protein
MLLIIGVECPDFLLDFRYCTGHLISRFAEDQITITNPQQLSRDAKPQSLCRNWRYLQ